MTVVTIIIGVLAFIIGIPLLAALFMKREYTIRRDIIINKPKGEVFDYIKYIRNQDNYNKWVMIDPGMKKEFKGTDGNVGFTYAWDSTNKQAGKGELEIKKLIEGERLEVEIRFERPMSGIAQAPYTTESISPTQTKLTWGMTGHSKYPMNLMNPFFDKLLGKDLESSLATLKNILE